MNDNPGQVSGKSNVTRADMSGRESAVPVERRRNTDVSGEHRRTPGIAAEVRRNTGASIERRRNSDVSGERHRNPGTVAERRRSSETSAEVRRKTASSVRHHRKPKASAEHLRVPGAQDGKTLWEYTSSQLFWVIIIPFNYFMFLFRCLGTLSYRTSAIIYIVLCLIFAAGGIYFSWRFKYYQLDVVRNSFTGCFVYFLLTYFRLKKGTILIILSIFILVALGYGVVLYRKWKIQSRGSESIEKNKLKLRFRKMFISSAGAMLTLGIAAVLIFFSVMKFLSLNLLRSKVDPEIYDNAFKELVAENMDTISMLKPEKWDGLDAEKRVDVAQVLVNLEVNYLGIPTTIPVGADVLEEKVLASYNPEKNVISINIDKMDSFDGFVFCHSVCHEVYHAYQNYQVLAMNRVGEELKSLRMFHDIETYEKEQENYFGAGADDDDYAEQLLETNADEWGEKRAYYYYYGVYNDKEVGSDGVAFEKTGMSLYRGDGTFVAGPYPFIEQSNDTYNRIRRFKNDEGKFGYLDRDGKVLVEAKFISAGPMTTYGAVVSEKEGQVYYINASGARISEDFLDGTEFEWGGIFARVKTSDGKWNVMDFEGKLILTGADAIDPLCDIDRRLYGAVINGHAALITVTSDGDRMLCEVKKELDQYTELKFQEDGCAVIAGTAEGLYGVLDRDGEELIPPEYTEISYEFFSYKADNTWIYTYLFTLHKPDGTVEYLQKDVNLW